jgi:hypothetical protein
MKTIWKFKLTPVSALHIPAKGKLMTVQVQREEPCLWVLVDPNAQTELRVFDTYGTGHNLPENPGTYVATFQTNNGHLVWHVFERARSSEEHV